MHEKVIVGMLFGITCVATNVTNVSAKTNDNIKRDMEPIVSSLDYENKVNLNGYMYLDSENEINVYEKSRKSSKHIETLRWGSKVQVIESKGDWIKIKYGGKVGFVVKGELKFSNVIELEVINDSLLYKIDGKKKKITKGSEKISKGNMVRFEGIYEDEKYYIVNIKNRDHLIDRKDVGRNVYISNESGKKVVGLNKTMVNGGSVDGFIPVGAKVAIVGGEGDTLEVVYGNLRGYVNKKNISNESVKIAKKTIKESLVYDKPVSDEIINKEFDRMLRDEIENLKQDKYNEFNDNEGVSVDPLFIKRIRTKALNKYGVRELDGSKTVEILSNQGEYIKIVIDNDIKYIKNEKDFFDKDDEFYIESRAYSERDKSTRYIKTEKVPMYVDGTKDSYIRGYLVKGMEVKEVYKEAKGGFSVVDIKGCGIGFVESKYLSKEKNMGNVGESVVYVHTGRTHESYVKSQIGNLNIVFTNSGFGNARHEEIAYYSNPKLLGLDNKKAKYQFLKLNEFRSVNEEKLNKYLNEISVRSGKVNIFEGKASAFVTAAKEYNIDPIYLVAHTILETGFGQSKLAQGIEYNGVTVYNFFGIGAVDSNPIGGGCSLAYREGWTSIDTTIRGSAGWISRNYINSKKNNQNTVYKMRYNYESGSHQYASDIGWAYKISSYMSKLSYMYEDAELKYEVPVYR